MRKLLSAILGLVGIVSLSQPVRAQGAQVVIPDQVQVHGAEIRLSDIAQVSGASTALQAQIDAARLGPSPRPGESLVLPRSTMLTRLRSNVPGAASMEWKIADRVTIRRAASRIELPQVTSALKSYLASHQAVAVEKLEVDGIQVRVPVVVPEGQAAIDFESSAGDDLLGQTSLTMVVRVDGELAARVPVRARVSADVRVMVSARSVRMGQTISDSDVHDEVRSLSEGLGRPAISRDEVVGKIARRAFATNQVMGVDDVQAPPAIRRGDPVIIVVHTPHLVVTCPGEARADGRVGELVSVTNTMTHRELRGRLGDNGEVLVEYRAPAQILESLGQP